MTISLLLQQLHPSLFTSLHYRSPQPLSTHPTFPSLKMLYVPFVASFCALTSVVSAAPVALEDRGLLSGLIGGVTGSSSKVTKLNTIVSGLQTSTAPLLANIRTFPFPCLTKVSCR